MAASDGDRKQMCTGKAPVKHLDNALSRNAPLTPFGVNSQYK